MELRQGLEPGDGDLRQRHRRAGILGELRAFLAGGQSFCYPLDERLEVLTREVAAPVGLVLHHVGDSRLGQAHCWLAMSRRAHVDVLLLPLIPGTVESSVAAELAGLLLIEPAILVRVPQLEQPFFEVTPTEGVNVVPETTMALLEDMTNPLALESGCREELLDARHYCKHAVVHVSIVTKTVLTQLKVIAGLNAFPTVCILELLWSSDRQGKLLDVVREGDVLGKGVDRLAVHGDESIAVLHRAQILNPLQTCHDQVGLANIEASLSCVVSHDLDLEVKLVLGIRAPVVQDHLD
mmetsp:Transcript_124575/g.398844  ORF Transcript_124575/g.398844 Transcript_124575/m.398844 type:complete len:295 (-) Transcript_124575:1424-2308(-)